jgi:hypothetical protein
MDEYKGFGHKKLGQKKSFQKKEKMKKSLYPSKSQRDIEIFKYYKNLANRFELE